MRNIANITKTIAVGSIAIAAAGFTGAALAHGGAGNGGGDPYGMPGHAGYITHQQARAYWNKIETSGGLHKAGKTSDGDTLYMNVSAEKVPANTLYNKHHNTKKWLAFYSDR